MAGKRKTKAIVYGGSGKPHRVFLIRGGSVWQEWDTDEYLAMKRTALGYWKGGFHFK